MYIDVERINEDKLSSVLFRFWISTEYGPTLRMILDVYAERTRRTKRCKWVNDKIYSRLDRRNSNLEHYDVRIPESVEKELKDKLKKMVDKETIKKQTR